MESSESAYQLEARRSLGRATELLVTDDAHNVRYAALELRMAIEALVMGRAAAYQDEIGEAFMSKWHPRDLLQRLRTVDPRVDRQIALAMETGTDEDRKFVRVGETRPVSLEELGKLHNSLGFYLHAPTLSEAAKGVWLDQEKARGRCKAAMQVVSEAVDASILAMKFKFYAYSYVCARCKADNYILNLAPEDTRFAPCHSCKAPYKVVGHEGRMEVNQQRMSIRCATRGCEHRVSPWLDEIRAASKYSGDTLPALEWTCPTGHVNEIRLLNMPVSAPESSEGE